MKNLIFVLLCLPLIGLGQNDCGTIPTQQQIDYLSQTRSARQNWNQIESTTWIPVQHHVVTETNGSGGLSMSDITLIMNTLNTYYSSSNLQFYECDSINYINDSTYYDFDANDENIFCGSNDIQDVINIYYFNTVTSSSGSSLCGYTRFPPSVDRVIMKNSCAINGSTIVHELGHFFSLYHTHGPTNTGTTTELVNGSNCSTAGDDLCGTPADPNLSGLVTNSCQYTGTAVDANGQAYVPDPTNIMSYSQKVCRTFLSSDQYNRANYSALNDRSYLTCSAAGCTDSSALNYNSLSIVDDGSCCFIAGCTDPLALNYVVSACFDDGSCIAPILGCTVQTASNYDPNANVGIAFGGALDNTFGAGSYFNGDQHLNFDASKVCVIKSASVYAQVGGVITFELRDNNSIVIDDTTLSVVVGQQTINLNFNVPIGSGLQLGVSVGALVNTGLYRNNSNSIYPYDIASVISITSSSASSPGFYYFYYDIEVETPCLYGTINSSFDCDGQGNCIDPGTGTGHYTSLSACESNCIQTSVHMIGIGSLKAYPNPNDGYFTVKFSSLIIQDLKVKITSAIGEIVFIDNSESYIGEYKRGINLKDYANGIYFLEIETNKGTVNKKIVLY